ncbi:MAG: flagellar type III secretion system pore protein FliP [Firmicutes bacterium]|nr:flagellar type III secretion system pore protein FliP [Bacillota bacterium]
MSKGTFCRVKLIAAIMIMIIIMLTSSVAYADPEVQIPKFLEPAESREDVATSLQIIFLLTILSLAPAILIMMTSFTRIIIILSFLRRALGTQQMPPNQVMIGLALFLTFFIMAPIGTEINNQAIQPYLNEEISQSVALERASQPLRQFMLRHTREKDLALFVNLSNMETGEDEAEFPMRIIIPSFIISELKTAFQFGFILYIPFLVLDMVVASTLMSMGMMMLPPVMISLPFKVLLFIMVDGWNLITQSVIISFK